MRKPGVLSLNKSSNSTLFLFASDRMYTGLKAEQATLERTLRTERTLNVRTATSNISEPKSMRRRCGKWIRFKADNDIRDRDPEKRAIEESKSFRTSWQGRSLDSKRDEALAAFDQEIEKARTELAEAEAKRGGVFDTLPANLAAVYNRLVQRSRDGIAVAEVVNGSCSACFISLRPQVQVEVRRMDSIITCENCTRILYVRAKLEQSEAAA